MQAALVPLSTWLVVLPVLLPLLGGGVLIVGGARMPRPAIFSVLILLLTAAADAGLFGRVMASGPVVMTMGRWLPPFGISFAADTIGAGFALLAALVSICVLTYRADAPMGGGRFLALLLLLLAGVDGAFLTGDLFNLYVWFELILIAAFGLLVLSGTPLTIDATVKYALLNFVATSLFLAALGLVYGALGTLNMADIIGAAASADPAVMGGIGALLVVALATKAAAFPLNAWLPASYHAPPAAVSALLGGLLTKVGAYALLRILVLVLPAELRLLHPALGVMAGATLLLAPLGAIAEAELRRVVGYLLIGGIGTIVAGLALPNAIGIAGAVVYVVNAMLTISGLYLLAGLVEAHTGARDSRRMAGLYTARPLLSGLFVILILTIAGVPPSLGFWPKLLLLQAAVARAGGLGVAGGADPVALPLAACLLLNALLTLFAGARLWSRLFWRPARESPGNAAAATAAAMPWAIGTASGLTALVLVAGLWPQPLLDFGRGAAAGLLDPHAYIHAVGLEAEP
jgi:multicomponent Na+:H+ antiporter subunit D